VINEVKIGIENLEIAIDALGLCGYGEASSALAPRVVQEMVVVIGKTLNFSG
jgi:hypothetical protein